MKNVYSGLNYFGLICVVMFSLGLVFRWIFRDVIALDQLLGLGIGIIILITAFFVKRYSKDFRDNKE
ncbi:hypothetical protein [Bacillus pseudomycoides]|uniref:hypothetical protein n=1 Tax=Bacillus pseudomycoides TaxID=64104 RepID=UPI000BEC2BC4|nr:hypothetical protein [Bacillus pseudomycoides]PDX97280.1 hypothetical protein COO07_28290 [Bacillus pseudomycoides]PEI32118.1 hypothetical protein CN641_30535 [Bacillus pseudomycoides]PEK73628.1 hypothetical protein CN597_28520 [Bacillus pseudomycoides]PEM99702.1 hypothetical protein CN640_29995 [Bacillus pseudomycoides]PGA65309.1 hypothetical protein COL87_28000 [Bacillus pseudomycoides]